MSGFHAGSPVGGVQEATETSTRLYKCYSILAATPGDGIKPEFESQVCLTPKSMYIPAMLYAQMPRIAL